MKNNLKKTNDIYFFSDKKKALNSCIKQINIANYQGIKKVYVSDIPIDTQWIFFTGENGFGKTTILRGIFIAIQGKNSVPTKEGLEETFIEFKTPNIHLKNHINEILTENEEKFVKFSDFSNLAAYGAKRTDLSDNYTPEIHENLFEKINALYDFEKEYSKWQDDPNKNKLKIKNIENILTQIVPNLSKIDIEKEGRYNVIYSEKSNTEEDYKPVYFNQLAMGMRSTIAMISDILFRFTDGSFDFEFNEDNEIDLSGIVLIDEFDSHLHPKWQKMLVEKLTKLFPKVQFIVSTHSPIPLLGAPKNTVILNVNRTSEDGITIKRLDIDITKLHPNNLLSSEIFGFTDYLSTEYKGDDFLIMEDDYNEYKIKQHIKKYLLEKAASGNKETFKQFFQ